MTQLEQRWRAALQGQRGVSSGLMRALCQLASYPYGWAVGLRNLAYDAHLFHPKKIAGACIISIGNLTVGGTGKTPFVLRLAEELAPLGPVAVLSRGYRSPAEQEAVPLWLSRGKGPELPVERVGDEPYLIASRFPQAHVIVGRHKAQAAQLAVQAGCRLILVDDGFQHRQLARDCDIVIVDAEQPFGNGSLFPRGILREPPQALKRAQLLVASNLRRPETFGVLAQQLKAYSSAPLIGTQVQIKAIRSLNGELVAPPPACVGLFCGIARPEQFVHTVTAAGMQVVDQLIASDHQLCSQEELKRFAISCKQKGAQWLLCTEKDAVKLPRTFVLDLPIAYVETSLEVVAGESFWREWLGTLC